jgi:glycolate oxidase FAD binding subunit
MGAPTIDLDKARTALESACDQVHDPGPDDAVDGVRPALVARPGSTEEVAGVLRAATEEGLTVVPRGNGTKMTWGLPPERADLVIDLSRMSAVLDHAAGDLIVQTQAGTPLTTVQETVSGAGQRLALDDPLGAATVGGALATNLSGPRRMAFGSARDLLIGVTIVRADGVVAKAGGRVVKNVAGYDLGKLMIGSFGTLAVVTESVFRLHPLPAARRLVRAPFDGPEEAQRLAQAVLQAQVVPSALEVEASADGGTVTVLLEGIEAGVASRESTSLGLLGPGAEATDVPAGWGDFPWTGSDGAVALKVTFPLSGLAKVLSAARTAADSTALDLRLRGSAGVGVAYGVLPAAVDPTAVARLVQQVRAECVAVGGSLVVVDGPPAVKQAVDVWGPVPALYLMRRVKEQFDPERRLAPGRFVGGI